MKKSVKILAVVMLFAMLSLTLVSCTNTLSGKYSAEVNIGIAELTVTYEFGPFGTVTRTSVSDSIISDEDTEVTKGKYEIFEDPENPDQLLISLEFEGEEKEVSSFVKGTENGVDYIRIGIIKYELVK